MNQKRNKKTGAPLTLLLIIFALPLFLAVINRQTELGTKAANPLSTAPEVKSACVINLTEEELTNPSLPLIYSDLINTNTYNSRLDLNCDSQLDLTDYTLYFNQVTQLQN